MTSKRQESKWREEAQEGSMDPPLSQIVRCQNQRDWDWTQREKADDFKQTGRKACGEKRERQMQARASFSVATSGLTINHQVTMYEGMK